MDDSSIVVATVDDALTALKTFTSGGTPKPCSAA